MADEYASAVGGKPVRSLAPGPALTLVAAVAVHSAYRIALSAVLLAADLSLVRQARESGAGGSAGLTAADRAARVAQAAFASDVLAGLLRAGTVPLAGRIERLAGAWADPGAAGDLRFFGLLAVLAAACAVLPAALLNAAPSGFLIGKESPGGIWGLVLSEVAGALGKAFGAVLLCFFIDAVSSGGPWRRWGAALAIAGAFVAMEVAGTAFARSFEKDLLHYEPGESVRPLKRPELVARVKDLCAKLGMPEAASDVMVDDEDDSLNAFAMTRVVVLSRTTAELPDVEHAAAIVAHELGHVSLKHVKKSVALDSALTLARFSLFFLVLILPSGAVPGGARWLSSALPLATLPRAAALFYSLARPLVDEVAKLAALWYSRASELSADRFGSDAVGREKYAEMLAKLGEANPGLGKPYDGLLAHRMTHPPAEARIRAVMADA